MLKMQNEFIFVYFQRRNLDKRKNKVVELWEDVGDKVYRYLNQC